MASGLGLIEIGLVASNIYSAHDINYYSQSVAYWLLTEDYVLNANILVLMLTDTELFSNVSGLGLGLMPSRPR